MVICPLRLVSWCDSERRRLPVLTIPRRKIFSVQIFTIISDQLFSHFRMSSSVTGLTILRPLLIVVD